MALLFTLPKQVPFTNAGALIPGARLYFYINGTSTPQDTYNDATLVTANTNPVIADSSGRFPGIWLNENLSYKVKLTDASDAEIYTVDDITDALTAAEVGALLNPRTQAEIGASVTPTNYSYPSGNVLRYGAVGDGATDDAAAVQLAVDVGGRVIIPADYTFLVNTRINLQADQEITGGGSLKTSGTNDMLRITSGCKVHNLILDSSAATSGDSVVVANGSTDFVIINNRFLTDDNTSYYLWGEADCSNGIVSNNYVEGNASTTSSGSWLIGWHDCVFEGNKFYYVGRAIQFLSGYRNTVTGNHIEGGVVGILFLSRKNLAANAMVHNVVTGNTCHNQSEEGISFDCAGSDQTTWSANTTNPIVTYASKTSPNDFNTTITISETGQATSWANDYFLAVLEGAATGALLEVSTSASASITVIRAGNQDALDELSGTPRMAVILPAAWNTIIGNTVRNSGTVGIFLYGSAWYNTITGNTVERCERIGIGITSVVNSLGTTPNWGVQCWSGCNVVSGNISGVGKSGQDWNDANLRSAIRINTTDFGTAPAVEKQSSDLVSGNILDASGITMDTTYHTTIVNNTVAAGGEIDLTDCTDVFHENNRQSNGDYIQVVESGTNTYFLRGSATWDPASIADGDEGAQDVTVTGAALGDFAIASFSLDVTDLTISASVTAADTVTVVLANNTGGAIDLSSGTVYAKVIK